MPAPERISLWPKGAPGTEGRRTMPEVAQDYWVKSINDPSLTVFPADPRHNSGAAIIVVPGGGHKMLVWTTEGIDIAPRLNQMGVTAFVLKYRLAREDGSPYSIERDAAGDLRRAIRWVRANASRYGIDPHRLGVMGFSAGGELVSLVADNPEPAGQKPADAIDRESDRPDFQVSVFPGPLGVPATAASTAPPAFITAGSLDKCCAVPALRLYEQLRDAGIPAELHLYAGADHAFNLGELSSLLSIVHWPDRLADWLADNGWLDGKSGAKP
ncbi:MAG TPA: alpha/beta hydrolase [Sphingomonas sp.]